MAGCCYCCSVTFCALVFLGLIFQAIYLLFSGLTSMLGINSSMFSWISYYIAGPFLVFFLILTYFNVNTQRPYNQSPLDGKKITYINGKIMQNMLDQLVILCFFWCMYYALDWINYYIPFYGMNILYEFGKGLSCSLLSVSRLDIRDQEVITFTSNFIAFYGSLNIFLKGIETLGY